MMVVEVVSSGSRRSGRRRRRRRYMCERRDGCRGALSGRRRANVGDELLGRLLVGERSHNVADGVRSMHKARRRGRRKKHFIESMNKHKTEC